MLIYLLIYQLPDVFDLLKLERSLIGILRCRVDVIRKQAIRKELYPRSSEYEESHLTPLS
jgi:predicted nucleotidyltransferase